MTSNRQPKFSQAVCRVKRATLTLGPRLKSLYTNVSYLSRPGTLGHEKRAHQRRWRSSRAGGAIQPSVGQSAADWLRPD